jgi:hypothetical protein
VPASGRKAAAWVDGISGVSDWLGACVSGPDGGSRKIFYFRRLNYFQRPDGKKSIKSSLIFDGPITFDSFPLQFFIVTNGAAKIGYNF